MKADWIVFDELTNVEWVHDDRVDALSPNWTSKWGVVGMPEYAALVEMREAGHWRAKAMLARKPYEINRFCRRVMQGRKRTVFLDEVRLQVVKMKLKGLL